MENNLKNDIEFIRNQLIELNKKYTHIEKLINDIKYIQEDKCSKVDLIINNELNKKQVTRRNKKTKTIKNTKNNKELDTKDNTEKKK